jgi:hypothetical protein
MTYAGAGEVRVDDLLFRLEEMVVDILDVVGVVGVGAIVVHFAAVVVADLEEAAVDATYLVVVDDTVVRDGYNLAFGLLLSRRLIMVVAAGRVCEQAGLGMGQTETTRVDQDTRCFAYVALLIEDSQCTGHGHHRLQWS